jgi:hypothetical protein
MPPASKSGLLSSLVYQVPEPYSKRARPGTLTRVAVVHHHLFPQGRLSRADAAITAMDVDNHAQQIGLDERRHQAARGEPRLV